MYTKTLSYIGAFYQRIVHYVTKNTKQTLLAVVALVLILAYSITSSSPEKAETFTVKMDSLKQYVQVSGQVSASRDADLSFQSLGQVAYVGVKVGDKVTQGKVLATLQAGDAQASLLQAQASLQNAQAVLGQLTQGARPEEIAIKQQVLDNAQSTFDQAYVAIPDVVQNVDSTTAGVIKNKLAALFIPTGDRYILSFTSCDQALQSKIEQNRTKLEITLAEFQKKSSTISALSQKAELEVAFEQAYLAALATNDLVNRISDLLLAPCSTTNTALDGFRTTLSSVQSSMTTLFSDMTTKRSTFTTAKNAVSQASRDLDLTKAGTDPYKLKAQAALVTQAEASVASAQAGLRKTLIISPFSGTISEVAIQEGETVSSGKTVISMLALDAFEIEAKVPEIDIVKVKVGALVDVTLDAYGKGVIFPATVTRVNPTSQANGSVPVYKVIVTFIGMTANVNIITESKGSVITVPARFITVLDDARGTVTLLKGGKEVEKAIELGIRGDGGSTEVVAGLVSGNVLVAPATTVRSSQKQSN
jgi:RND family efflux transporter MFP subunit